MAVFRPGTADEAAGVVRWAVAEAQPLELTGGGSKRGLGRPLQTEHTLDFSALSGIVAYEPAELVLTAAAGTPLATIEAAVAASGQMLAFEPPDWRVLLGSTDRAPTLGGTVSCNLSGSRRIKAGAARDHVLGFVGVNGRGEVFHAGGKVVKNVTGYDLCKLVAGSYGTLVALTELSVKILPRPEVGRTLVLPGLSDAAAVAAMGDALNSQHEVSGAAHLPAALTKHSAVLSGLGVAATLVRIEGPAPSVQHRAIALRDLLSADGEVVELGVSDTDRVWREVGDASLLAEPAARAVWRLSVPPANGAVVAADIGKVADAVWFFDWGGGLIWLAAEGADGGAAAIHGVIAAHPGSHATLIRGSDGLRASAAVFQPVPAALAALSARVKHGFDPCGVLNPGRLYPGV